MPIRTRAATKRGSSVPEKLVRDCVNFFSISDSAALVSKGVCLWELPLSGSVLFITSTQR